MAVRLEQSRLLIYKAAALKDAGRSITKEAAMAKLSASETATFVAHQAIQVIITIWNQKQMQLHRPFVNLLMIHILLNHYHDYFCRFWEGWDMCRICK